MRSSPRLGAVRDARAQLYDRQREARAPLLFALVAVSALGLIVLYSAGGGDIELVERQLVRLGIAYTCMLVVAQFPPRLLQRLTPWLFVTGILFLLAVLVSGETSGGAQRWLKCDEPAETVRLRAARMGGHATCFSDDPSVPTFQPLEGNLLALNKRFKAALDPSGILNPGRLHPEL